MRFENLDFEQGDVYWQETVIGAGTSAVQTNAANARSGSKYMLLSKAAVAGYPTAMAADKTGAQLYLPVVPGQIIQFGGWMYRESGANNAWVAGVAYDVNKATPVYFNVQQDGTIGSWKFYTGTYKVPAGKFFVSLYLQTDTTAAATSVRFDDVFFSPALDVQITTASAVTDQTPYLRHQSMTLKFNTFDFQLVDPTVTPALGDTVVAADPNLALSWSGNVVKVAKASVSEKGGHIYVTISATNQAVAVASVAPFDVGGTRNFAPDPGFEDTNLAATQTFWTLQTPAEFSLDTVNFHIGAKSLLCTTTRTAVGWNAAEPYMPGNTTIAGQPAFPVAPGMSYTASIWAKALAGSKQNHFKILWYKDTAGNLSDINTTTFIQGGTDGPYAWTQWSGAAVAPQDARYAVIALMYGYWDGVTGTNGQSWFDDFSWAGAIPFSQMKYDTTQDTQGAVHANGSFVAYQAGLWPIQTIDITDSDYGWVNQTFSVRDVEVSWPVKPSQPLFKVTFGDSVVTMSVWQASAAQSAVLPITTTKITDGAVTTPKVAAGAITADKLTAILVLASLIKAGTGVAHVEMDGNGLRAYDGSGNIVMNIPTDGVTPITMNAQVVAQALTSTGNAIFQGSRNEIALGSTLQLDASIGNPGGQPALAQTWNGVAMPINSTYDTSSSAYNRASLDYDAAGGAGGATKSFWTVTNKTSGTLYALELLASDRTVARNINLTTPGFKTVYGACRLGSYVYVLGLDGSTGAAQNWGATNGASYSYDFTGSGSDNQITTASGYTAPGNGTVTALTIRCAGYGANCGFYFCIWDGGGNLVANSSYTTLGSSLGDQTLGLSLVVTGGSTYYFGFWADRTGSKQWGVDSSGSFDYQTNLSGVASLSGRSACGSPYVCGNIRAYVTYTPDTRVARVRRFVQSTLTLDTTYTAVSYPVLVNSLPVAPAITQDGTNIFIVDRSTTIKWQKYDANMATVGGVVDTTYNPGANVGDAQAGNADIGAWRMMVLTNTVDSFDSTPTRQTANEGFSVPNSAGVGLTYGDALGTGARFWSVPVNGGAAVNLTQHSTWVWTTASSVYWVGYTYYDSVGTVHETQISPRASITMSRRAQLVITAPGSLPGTGGADDPNNYRFYTAPNATDPGATNFKLQATQTTATLTMTTYASGGSADPASNNFPSGSAAGMVSQTGGLSLKGDGTGDLGLVGTKYKFRAIQTGTAQGIASVTEPINFNSVDYDPNSNFNTTTHAYTAPVSGYYLMCVLVATSQGAVAGSARFRSWISLSTNGGSTFTETWDGAETMTGGANSFPGSYTMVIAHLNANDQIRAGCFLNLGAGSVLWNPTSNFFARFIGA